MNPLSGVLSEAWEMYKTYAKHLLAIAFVIYVIAAIVAALLSLAGTFGSLLGAVVSIVAAFLLQATLVKAVQDVRDGRVDMSIGETVRAATPYIGAVALASILAGIAIVIGLALVIVPGLYLITIWAVLVPVIVIERSGALAAFGRSRQLVRGRGWHVFATLVLVYVILLVVDIVLGLIFSALPHVLGSGLSQVISGTLISPFLALVVTLVYYRLSASAPGTPVSRRDLRRVPAAAARRWPLRRVPAAAAGRRMAAVTADTARGRELRGIPPATAAAGRRELRGIPATLRFRTCQPPVGSE